MSRRQRFGLYGANSRTLLTWGGRILCHHDRAQMEWLHPGTRVVEVPSDIPADQCLPIQQCPEYGAIQFTRDGDIAGKEQFRAR
jgi:hypothetical protein